MLALCGKACCVPTSVRTGDRPGVARELPVYTRLRSRSLTIGGPALPCSLPYTCCVAYVLRQAPPQAAPGQDWPSRLAGPCATSYIGRIGPEAGGRLGPPGRLAPRTLTPRLRATKCDVCSNPRNSYGPWHMLLGPQTRWELVARSRRPVAPAARRPR